MLRTLGRFLTLSGAAMILMLLAPLAGAAAHTQGQTSIHSATVSVFATGLNNPRGLKFGPGMGQIVRVNTHANNCN